MLGGDVIYAAIAAFAAFVIFWIQVGAISERVTEFDPQRPSSYFPLRKYLSSNFLHLVSYLASLPIAALFLIVCWRSKEAIVALVKEFAPKVINGFLPVDYHDGVTSAFENYFISVSYLSPLFCLLAALFLFAPYVNMPIIGLQGLFIRSTGVEEHIDDIALEASRASLRAFNNDYAKLREQIGVLLGVEVPLREELAAATPQQKIAYTLIYAATNNTRKIGLKRGIESILIGLNIGGRPAPQDDTPTDWKVILLAVPAFAVMCALFILLFAYRASEPVRIEQAWSPSLFEWVYEPYGGTVQVLRYIFCFLVPLYLGFFIYTARRRSDDTYDTIGDCVRVACLQQVVIALIFSFAFCFLDSLEVIAGIQAVASPRETPYSVVTPKFWFDTLTVAILPTIVFLAWVTIRYKLKVRGIPLLATLVFFSALAPSLQAFGYEWYTHNRRGLYWYWMALGLWTTCSLMLVGLLDKGNTRRHIAKRLEFA
ncbi:hypothetical protein NKJ35_27205 [Mesorhizobium sp. M0136]|uniref:hypothetical protein n=1 Tax=Mesorhizobium sp. M0136 TaxID=2956890 RepID=UPI0033388053